MTTHRRRLFGDLVYATGGALVALALLSAAVLLLLPLWSVLLCGPPALMKGPGYSVEVNDRRGHLLRVFATQEGLWRLRTVPEDVDPRFLRLLLAIEDHRFFAHAGVDWFALVRAAAQDVTHARIVSGASTLTMQTVSLLSVDRERTLSRKLRQSLDALLVEQSHTKKEILSQYLGIVPFGGNLEGVRAASLVFFGKEPKHLSLAEAALLIAIPQAPAARRPDRHPDAAKAARDGIIRRAVALGLATGPEAAAAIAEPVAGVRRPLPALAAHATYAAQQSAPGVRTISLTIDAGFQRKVEHLLADRMQRNAPGLSAAIVVVDNATGEIRAHVGSPDYFARSNGNALDLAYAVRSPGSTLKPFIYGLGLDDYLIDAETLIDDRRMRFGSWMPRDFEGSFVGTVTVREALQNSLNLPAVQVLAKVGPENLVDRLIRMGARVDVPGGRRSNLAIGLGGVGIRLIDLVQAYVALARLGSAVQISDRADRPRERSGTRLFGERASWIIYDILRGARRPDFHASEAIAFKTGTSVGFRDAWAVGYDRNMTIGVWVGRPDGSPMPGLIGRSVAAPILFDAFALNDLEPKAIPRPARAEFEPDGSRLADGMRRFDAAGRNGTEAETLRILFPVADATVEVGDTRGNLSDILLEASGGTPPLRWLVDGAPVAVSSFGRRSVWKPEGLGFSRVTVIDRAGESDSVMIRVK